MFWDATPEDKHIFVADPATGSRHNRGCAVDLTLYDREDRRAGRHDRRLRRDVRPLLRRSIPAARRSQRWQRDLLRRAMEDEGFAVYEWEWWHFDYKDWKRYPVSNVRFDAIR